MRRQVLAERGCADGGPSPPQRQLAPSKPPVGAALGVENARRVPIREAGLRPSGERGDNVLGRGGDNDQPGVARLPALPGSDRVGAEEGARRALGEGARVGLDLVPGHSRQEPPRRRRLQPPAVAIGEERGGCGNQSHQPRRIGQPGPARHAEEGGVAVPDGQGSVEIERPLWDGKSSSPWRGSSTSPIYRGQAEEPAWPENRLRFNQ